MRWWQRRQGLESAVQGTARILSSQFGINVVFRGEECYADGKQIVLPSLPDDLPQGLSDAIHGYMDHEVGHMLDTDFDVLKSWVDNDKPCRALHMIWNIIEDYRVERVMCAKYPGSVINLRCADTYSRSKKEELYKEEDEMPLPNQILDAMIEKVLRKGERNEWIGDDAWELVEDLQEDLDEVPSIEDTTSAIDLAKRIWEKIKQHFPKIPLSKMYLLKLGTDGDGNLQIELKEVQAGEEVEPGEGAPSPMGLLQLIIKEAAEKEAQERKSYRPYTTEHDCVEAPPIRPDGQWQDRFREGLIYVGGLRARLLKFLLGQDRTRWSTGRSRGRINARALPKLINETSLRIFRQRTTERAQKAAITLLIDLSGSMSGRKLHLCGQLSMVFGEALSLLQFPTEVIGFSTKGSGSADSSKYSRVEPLYHAIFQQFGEPWRRAAGRLSGMETVGLTPIGESLLFAGRRICNRPEERKIIFCLTDGFPTVGGSAGDPQAHACWAVKMLQRAGIEPIGIGIQTHVGHIFPHSAMIGKIDDLPLQFMQELCNALIYARKEKLG